MIKRHNIVFKKQDGGIEIQPMKQWLRQNPQYIPEGYEADDTSHELRRALKGSGWRLKEKQDEVLLIKPSEDGDLSYAEEFLGTNTDENTNLDEDKIYEAEELTFGLERDLQKALRANIEQLEIGLKITDEGTELSTEAGRIDITATDKEGNLVVIELKAGTASPEVIAQVLAYMTALAESRNKAVRGILVAGDFHKKVIMAARSIPNVILKKYSFQFSFSSIK
jgi:endonuclease